MKIMYDLGLDATLKPEDKSKIKAQIYSIINDNYDDYFVKNLVQEISNTIIEFQFDYVSNEVYVREC